ncbi:hypothetical protein [Streptomyces chartreusis]|uniref:hypothetical protein n=1 Tax=Streptomyces chartreusis TaxID=1969 RepID=UPI0036333C87
MNPRIKFVAWALSTSLAVGGLYAASPTAANEHRTPTATHQQHTTVHDARTVFRGVFFGHGPVGDALARHFPGLPAATPQITAEENRVMNRLEKAHPGTIRDFHAAVASGSHVRTKQAITSTSRTLADVLLPDGRGAELNDVDPEGLFAFLVVIRVLVVQVRIWRAHAEERTALDLDTLTHDVIRSSASARGR